MSNRTALDEFLSARPSVSPLLAALARSLADELDSCPEVGFAATAKEYRAVVDRLLSDDSAGGVALSDLFAEVGDPS